MSSDRVSVTEGDATGIHSAVVALRAGAVVGLPTETVYGLAARASDAHAVARIFRTKGRPADHPLIVHIGDSSQVDEWAVDVPDFARSLMSLWPGPLTLVLRKQASVNPALTGGQDTIALRMPAHPIALAVLRELGDAIAAPSANRFGQVSPTTAAHVLDGLGDWLSPADVILDGGACAVGVESTIVDCTGDQPRILRPGAISAATVAAVAGIATSDNSTNAPRVSGSLESHYAPTARVVLIDGGDTSVSAAQARLEEHGVADSARIGVMGINVANVPDAWLTLLNAADVDAYARGLYSALRSADAEAVGVVVAVMPPAQGIGVAIRDRLMRAAAGR